MPGRVKLPAALSLVWLHARLKTLLVCDLFISFLFRFPVRAGQDRCQDPNYASDCRTLSPTALCAKVLLQTGPASCASHFPPVARKDEVKMNALYGGFFFG